MLAAITDCFGKVRDLFSFSTAEQILIRLCVSTPHFLISRFSIDLSILRLSE